MGWDGMGFGRELVIAGQEIISSGLWGRWTFAGGKGGGARPGWTPRGACWLGLGPMPAAAHVRGPTRRTGNKGQGD
jgi:hypothetical protein